MRRLVWLLPCALLACKTEPAQPDPAETLAKLEDIQQRLQSLEGELQQGAERAREADEAVQSDAPSSPPTTTHLGKMAVDVIAEAPPSSDRMLSVEVTPSGYVVDGESLDDAAMTRRIEELVGQHADASLVVRAADGVDHAKVVALLDIAKERGLKRLAIAKPSDDQQGS